MINNYAKVMGGILFLIGVLGFIPALAPDGMLFGIFRIDAMHNVFHLVSGLVLLGVGLSNNWEASRKMTLLFAAIYGIITLLGFLSPNNVVMGMQMNLADNVLHLGITASALLFGLQQRHPMYR